MENICCGQRPEGERRREKVSVGKIQCSSKRQNAVAGKLQDAYIYRNSSKLLSCIFNSTGNAVQVDVAEGNIPAKEENSISPPPRPTQVQETGIQSCSTSECDVPLSGHVQ